MMLHVSVESRSVGIEARAVFSSGFHRARSVLEQRDLAKRQRLRRSTPAQKLLLGDLGRGPFAHQGLSPPWSARADVDGPRQHKPLIPLDGAGHSRLEWDRGHFFYASVWIGVVTYCQSVASFYHL